ncbi:MAG TPA: DUF2784 domain-containing protein [Stellaceae bacterium]|nr:DUF2784 domain-containing protein [Stellaceae bacterium]
MQSPAFYSLLAIAVLLFHLAIILFNVFGLIVIPLGAWRGWRFVRVFWWRALHLAILGVVAIQAVLDQVCFLTAWQGALERAAGEASSDAPFIAGFINRLIYWPLPISVFAVAYVAICLYVILLWVLVPPRRQRRLHIRR